MVEQLLLLKAVYNLMEHILVLELHLVNIIIVEVLLVTLLVRVQYYI